MNLHFIEMLRELFAAGAEFLIIGAHAVAAHGHPRSTTDIDFWIRPTPENARHVWKALANVGAPVEMITFEDLHTPGLIFQIGIDPVRIDILTAVEPLDFESAWQNRAMLDVDGETFPFLGRDDLIRSKRAAGRPHDLLDIEYLERQ